MSGDIPKSGPYLLIFKSGEKRVSLGLKKENDAFSFTSDEPNKLNKSQIWVFYHDTITFSNLLYPHMYLEDQDPDADNNTLTIHHFRTNEEEEKQKFEINSESPFIRGNNLNKYLVYDFSENIFRFSPDIPSGLEFSMEYVDVRSYSIHHPPIGVPFAIVFSIAAQEYALTFNSGNSHPDYSQGRILDAKPFKPGTDANQYFYYLPTHHFAIYCASETNMSLDMMTTCDDNNTVYAYPHHGNKNQQWKFSKRNIICLHSDNNLTYDPDSPFHFKACKHNYEFPHQHFACCPYWEPIEGVKTPSQVANSSDFERNPYSSDFDGFSEHITDESTYDSISSSGSSSNSTDTDDYW